MNVRILALTAVALLPALTGCIQERDSYDTNPSSDSDSDTDTDSDSDTDADSDDAPGAYTFNSGELDIDRDFNPYPGLTIGFFADEGGTEDGWARAIAIVPQTDEGDLEVNLNLFGPGQSVRWALATLTDDNSPDNWLWESGVIAENLVDNDTMGLTLWVEECVGEELVDKLNFCTRLTSSGIEAGECWGTHVEPESCTDADNDGDVDPDTGGSDDTGDDSGDSGDSSGSRSSVTISVTKDSSWCSGQTWEVWAWNESGWVGNWPSLSSTEYIATGSGDTLTGSLSLGSGDYYWIQGKCSDGSTWLGESSGEHIASATVGGTSQTIAYSTTSDTPSAGTWTKRSSSYDLTGRY